jgi:hypothetical protein
MALVLKDRVKETTTTTGTGSLTLLGASVGYQAFSVIGNGNTCYYAISSITSNEWEVGIGTYSTTGPTLARTTILSSSNSGSVVNLSVGTKDVYVVYPAEKAVYEDSANKVVQNDFVDLNASGTATIATATITSGTVSSTPVSATDLVNKTYVDALVSSGVHFHQPVRVESPTALTVTYNNGTAGVGATLTNAGTQVALVLDGITMVVADRVLIYQQTNQTQNGVYVVTSIGSGSTNWVLTRSDDTDTYGFDSPNALSEGSTFFVQQGATGAGETYTCNTVGVITFGTTNITFVQISSAQIYSAGTGLTLSGTQFSITPVGTASTYGSGSSVPVLTTNASGQVSSVTNTSISINANQVTSGTLAVAQGGTNLSSYVVGDLVYASGTGTLAGLADAATGNVLLSGGTNTAPLYGKVGLGTHISGTLAVSNGGTGLSTLTANGVLYASTTSAFSQDANFVYSSSTLSVPSLSLSSNLTFTGTGNRITGDMNNGTLANRLMFQNSVTNGATSVGAMPNGTGANSAYNVFAGSDPANTSFGQFRVGTDTGDVRITSGITGTGTYLPLTMFTGGSERLRIVGGTGSDVGNVGIGTNSPGSYRLNVQAATGLARILSTTGTNGAGLNINNTAGDLWFGRDSSTASTFGLGNYAGVISSEGAYPFIISVNSAQRMRINFGGEVGIGVTPETWQTGISVLQVGTRSALFQGTGGGVNLSQNYYQNAAGTALYLATGAATIYNQNNGSHVWSYAASGTAGAAITVLEAMRIDTSGNLLVKTTSSAYNLAGRGVIELNGSSDSLMAWKRADSSLFYIHNNASGIDFWNIPNTFIRFATNSTERMRIHASGGVSIGNQTDPGNTNLSVTGNINFGANGNGFLIGEAFPSGNSILRSAIDIVFQSNFGGTTERMRIGAQGGISFSTSGFGTSGQILRSSGSTANPVWINQSAIAAGTASTAVNLSTTQGTWSTNGTISAVVGLLAWKNYGNNHVIFDASNGTTPSGTACNNTNADIAWSASYPTLMGWNGGNTYGVRVDYARIADGATTATNQSGGTVSATTGTFSGNLSFNSGYGSSALAYGCRAWVNFNGTTNVGGFCTIRASGNVSSVSDGGVGIYTVNFTTSISDANYAVSGACGKNVSTASVFGLDNDTQSAAAVTVTTRRRDNGATVDQAQCQVMIIR